MVCLMARGPLDPALLGPHPLCQKLSHILGPLLPSSVTYIMDGLLHVFEWFSPFCPNISYQTFQPKR